MGLYRYLWLPNPFGSFMNGFGSHDLPSHLTVHLPRNRCSFHWLHCPLSFPQLADRHGARPAALAAGTGDPSPFSIAQLTRPTTIVTRSWCSVPARMQVANGSPFSIVEARPRGIVYIPGAGPAAGTRVVPVCISIAHRQKPCHHSYQ